MSEDKREQSNKQASPSPEFLSDLTDGREKGDWKSRYDPECQIQICWEKKYLIALFLFCFIPPLLLGIACTYDYWNISNRFSNLKDYCFAFFGGTLGGTLFAVKWLVHSVAKNSWNLDRRLWRIFTPFLSGALAFAVILLINSSLFGSNTLKNLNIHKSYGIGFLVGYFSDSAIGKLTEIAQVFFGSSLSQKK